MADAFKQGLAGLDTGPEASADGAAAAPAGDLPPHPSVDALRERFGTAILRHEVHAGDEHVVFIDPARNAEILGWLRDDPSQRYALLLDVTGVDYGGGRPLQVVYQLWSLEHRRLLRVKAELPLRALEIRSVVPLWRTADWLEREAYDLFGIQFTGHPDLRRIMMPENYEEGHPLRKDFPLRGRFSRAEQTRRALAIGVEESYSPDELRIADVPLSPAEPPVALARGAATGSAAGAPAPLVGSQGAQQQGQGGPGTVTPTAPPGSAPPGGTDGAPR